MKANRKELAILRGKRTPETLEEWAKVFGEGDRKRAERYALAVATFLGTNTSEDQWSDYLGQLSPNTRKAYAYAVSEFFEWVAVQHGRIVPPHLVIRKDAEDYVNWLANRPFSLAEEKLKDGDMEVYEKLFSVIKELRAAKLKQIVSHLDDDMLVRYFKQWPLPLGVKDPYYAVGLAELSRDVRKLVTLDVVASSPTLSQVREKSPQAGITQWEIDGVPLMHIFSYTVKGYSAVSRTTVALRISALSSFWKILMQGENLSGGEALLQYNIWDAVKKRVTRGIAPMKRAAAREQKVPSEAVLAMLEKAPTKTLADKRNKAILYLMVFSGLRTTEVLLLRRGSTPNKKMPFFDGGEPPALQVLRKGNKWMRIPYPPVALKTLVEFQAEIDARAASPETQWKNPGRSDYLPAGHVRYYYRDLQLPDAPLFPSIDFWGNNQRKDYRKSMSRIQLYRILKRVAEEAGVSQEMVDKVHPHAIRHFSANAMSQGGKDIREIQHILGHTSITTTEGYLEDIDDEVKLSGQAEILQFLKTRGVEVEPHNTGEFVVEKQEKRKKRPEATTIDTYAIEMDESEEATPEEIEILDTLVEQVPGNELPEIPEYQPPDVVLVDTSEGQVLVEPEGAHLIGIVDEEPSETQLEEIIETIHDGRSPGAPSHVYEALMLNKNPEQVVFNRGGQKDLAWLISKYPKMPKDFGVGKNSLLPWYVKAKGNISESGFYRGMPPFPVWSPDQVSPDTFKGRQFVEAVERLYVRFLHGDVEKGIAPSQIRGVGLIKWFGFFAYLTNKFLKETGDVFAKDRMPFLPWDALIDINEEASPLRTHDDAWLLDWLERNAHTFRASVDAMKRGVPKGKPRGAEKESLIQKDAERDIEKFFLRSSFEGIDLIDKMPEWMTEDDPVHALYRDDPKEYGEFVKWLRNVTGQALSADRKAERADAKTSVLLTAESIKGLLVTFYEEIDTLSEEKTKGSAVRRDDEMQATRQNLRLTLYGYLLKASGLPRIDYSFKQMEKDSTTEFNKKMASYFEEYGVPNPNDKKYREIPRIKDRIDQIVRDIFPENEELADVNIFADSALFDPRWFRIDDKKKTITIDADAVSQLKNEYGIKQSPLLLVRRAARAMYEAREKGYDKLWGVMMSYFAWVVPTGAQMEEEARGIPVKESGSRMEDRFARREWLREWVLSMKEIAEGDTLKKALQEKKAAPGSSQPLEEVETFRTRGDILGHAMTGIDFALASSADAWSETPEDLLISMESGSYIPNRRRAGYLKNGRSMYLHLQGEKPAGWYRINLFGDREEMRRNPSPDVYASPAILFNVQKKVEPARLLLPSPFRMIAAMDQE